MTSIKHFTKEKLMIREYETINYCGSIGDFIVEQYYGRTIPYSVFDVSTAAPCLENDITFDINKLCEGNGEYVVMETPAAGLDVAAWIMIISTVISVAVAATMKIPKLPNNVQRDDKSANNIAGARSNQARPLQRIPDIRGTVKSIPDIIMPPYARYVGIRDKVEYGYYCVGRKTLDIPLTTINDGDTPINKIEGATVEIYGPNKSPMNSSPDYIVGEDIDLPLYSPYRSNEVDGVPLPAPQDVGGTNIFNIDNYIYLTEGETTIACYDVGQPTYFEIGIGKKISSGTKTWLDENPDYYVGNSLNLADFIVNTYTLTDYQNISGKYKIVDITYEGETIPTSDVWWYTIKMESNGMTFNPGIKEVAQNAYVYTEFSTPYNVWYYMTRDNFTTGFVNIVAPGGLYRDTGTGVLQEIENEFVLEVEPLDVNNDPTGTPRLLVVKLASNTPPPRYS